MCGLFGVVYFIFAICMLNYGIRMYWMLNNLKEIQANHDEKEIVKLIARWVIIITGALSIIFTIRSVFNLLFIIGLIPRFFP
jgi:hypothetical protein